MFRIGRPKALDQSKTALAQRMRARGSPRSESAAGTVTPLPSGMAVVECSGLPGGVDPSVQRPRAEVRGGQNLYVVAVPVTGRKSLYAAG